MFLAEVSTSRAPPQSTRPLFTANFRRHKVAARRITPAPPFDVILLASGPEIRPAGNVVLGSRSESDQGVKKPSHKLKRVDT
jgi:hypothetical protein